MKVAIFADSLPPSTDGVAHTYCRLAESLNRLNIQFRFFSPFKPDDKISWSADVENMPYIPFLFYPHYRIGIPAQSNLFRKLDKFNPDIVHVSSPTIVGNMALRYARQRNIPAVAAYHTDFIAYFKYYGFQFAELMGWNFLRWFYNQFDKTVAPSHTTKQILEKNGFKAIDLWQRGINTQNFNPAFKNQKNKKLPRLLFVGRLVKEKDLDDLVQAYKLINKVEKKCELYIVGGGDYQTELQKKVPDAIFSGYLHGQRLAETYASADIFVFPSTTETFGNVVLEAMASGLPVIVSNKGACQDLVINGQTGYICQANNADDLAKYVDKLISSENLRQRFAENAIHEAGKYDWDQINQKLINTYKTLISNKYKISENIYLKPQEKRISKQLQA